MMKQHYILLLLVLLPLLAMADPQRPYRMEVGLQGGTGYYVGDATPHLFQQPSWAAGGQARYKFTPNWALALYGVAHHYNIPAKVAYVGEGRYDSIPGRGKMMGNIDVRAEYNFLRLGPRQYDRSYHPASPYIFLGVGAGVYHGINGATKAAAYIPFGIGVKWMFAPRWGLNLSWQHNLYFADDLEGHPLLDNTYRLNGKNIYNFDLTSQLMLGIVFEFWQAKKICKMCNYR